MAKVDISKLLKKAEEAFNKKNFPLAIFNYTQAVSLAPDSLEARTRLRATQLRAYNENGGSGFKALLALLKAKLLAATKKHEQALLACETVLGHNPQHLGALSLFAECAEKLEMWSLAAWQRQEIADKYARDDTGNLEALAEIFVNLGKGEDAVKVYERIKEVDPEADVDAQIRQAAALKMTDIFQTAVDQGSRKILKSEENTLKLELDSQKLRTDEQRMKAIQYRLENDAKERPNDHRVFLQIGEYYMEMDDWATGFVEAKKYFQKAQEINASDNTVLDKLGDVEIKNFKLQLQALVEQAKTDAGAKAKYKELQQKRLAFELEEFERRVRAQPLKAAFRNRLGEIYFQYNRHDDAIGQLQQCSKDPKFKISAYTLLGRCFLATQQLDMAIEAFQKAREGQELFEKIRDPIYFEAQVLVTKGDADSVEKALALVIQLYQADINFRDVKKLVPSLQAKLKELKGA